MFQSDLFDADGNPVEFYVDRPDLGRRAKVRLCARGPEIRFRELDVPDYQEPPLPDQPPQPGDVDVRRRTPLNADDFVGHPDPTAA